MLKFAAAIVVGACAMGAAQAVMALKAPEPGAASESAQLLRASVAVEPSARAGQAASIVKAADGHYWAEAQVNGKRVRFLVDTGATAVALTLEDARRLGFRDADLDYALPVSTANGQARGARVVLQTISVAGAKVEQVDAIIVERGLPASLLGMAYLGRLSRFEATPTTLVLHP